MLFCRCRADSTEPLVAVYVVPLQSCGVSGVVEPGRSDVARCCPRLALSSLHLSGVAEQRQYDAMLTKLREFAYII